ncbi:amino acid deaminase [Dongia soli]|uniref:Amino acid deaminase n=1 Tax=Dongia soli TaxID=600628 RepID=A0ABU5E5M3_9PROT|nr:amino acid deaminase [Dongia soli]MDY0881344.1 amino acid deaminase [Dongia soli]
MIQAGKRSQAANAEIIGEQLRELGAMKLDWRSKGVPGAAEASKLAETAWNVLAGDLPFPVAVLKQTALRHNSNWMQRFLAATGVSLAPHGKTTMAPQLFAQQLNDGCWGITVATAQQAIVCAEAGIRRILMANQLVGAANIAQILSLLRSTPDLDFYCYVDSASGVGLLAEALRGYHDLSLNVLLEMGVKGGRTGCRSIADAVTVLHAIAKVKEIKLRGVAGFEGMIHGASQAETEARVTAFLDLMAEAFMLCRERQAFAHEAEAIISAGGSSFFDIVAHRLKEMRDPGPTRIVIRSGCYLTHDSGLYDDGFPELARRLPRDLAQQLGSLQPGLFIWSCVQSRPEPGLALLTMGKRDASHDAGLPIPVLRGRTGSTETTPLDRQWQIKQMNDQHAYLHLPEPADLQVGDLICCGISHPCTTFDKWRVIPLVDDNWSVTGAVHTYF